MHYLTNPSDASRPPLLDARHNSDTSQNVARIDGSVRVVTAQRMLELFTQGTAAKSWNAGRWQHIAANFTP